MVNTFAMTLLLVSLGLAGESELAAEIGIVQGATLALFYAFSANARSLILNESSQYSAGAIMLSRIVLVIPLALIAYWLSVKVAGVPYLLASVLILRRITEWLSEVHLSEMEKLGNQSFARTYLVLQSLLLTLVIVWTVGGFPNPLLGFLIWAIAPLTLSISAIGKSFTEITNSPFQLALKMMPHFGSTAIIGVTVYIFRLLIILLTGKEIAGDLFTAFAIGGLTGSLFANAFGASIALHEQRSGKKYFPQSLRWILNLLAILGAGIYIAASLNPPELDWTGKSDFFWQATGLSMIGGVVMVYAQRIRFRLLHGDKERDVFGPDVLINILIIASVPFLPNLMGMQSMASLYLLSALLSLLFYFSFARKGKLDLEHDDSKLQNNNYLYHILIAVLILLPLFFQISGGVFNNPGMNFDSGGVLSNLPIPISVLACYGGILLLGAYQRAYISFGFIFLVSMAMLVSTIVTTGQQPIEQQAKLILYVQYILPMVALVLGQIYIARKPNQSVTYAKAFLWVLVAIVPLNLFSSWIQGLVYLSPYFGLFSIYQHLQYVPVVFVSAYLIALFALWHFPRYKKLLLVLLPFMAIYVAASISMLAIGLFFIGFFAFVLFQLRIYSEKLPFAAFFLALVLSGSYFQFEKDQVGFKFGFLEQPASQTISQGSASSAPNVSGRIVYWNYYLDSVMKSPKLFLFGHAAAPDRTKYPSAHNYYLDYIYNFGALAVLPILLLIAYTIRLIYRHRVAVLESAGLSGLCLVVLFLLIADNSLKVGMRQPYPGIFTFFLWGILISTLMNLSSSKKLR